ncbi:MAG TPA: hypothetical protein VJ255_04945, partial [Candidatus Acidoferrum sp.]|nr:hypothetical protein [Candidatus Acidoferrum sp.]
EARSDDTDEEVGKWPNFAMGQVSSIACSATDKNGKRYELRFESDGSPITLSRLRPSAPSIRTEG